MMERKGVGKRKTKKDSSSSSVNTRSSSNSRSGEHPVVASRVGETGVLLNGGGTNPSAGSKKKHKKGS